jgi:hypothetical protein
MEVVYDLLFSSKFKGSLNFAEQLVRSQNVLLQMVLDKSLIINIIVLMKRRNIIGFLMKKEQYKRKLVQFKRKSKEYQFYCLYWQIVNNTNVKPIDFQADRLNVELKNNLTILGTTANEISQTYHENQNLYKSGFVIFLMNLKNTLLSILTAGIIFLAPKLAEAINVNGVFINAPFCSVKVWRINPTNTQYTEAYSSGMWGIETENFSPPSQIGDSLYVEGGWNLGGNAKTSHIVKASANQVYDLTLDKFTGCIEEIIDTSGLHDSIPLMCEYWIDGFAPETTQVDTHNIGWTHGFDLHAAFEDSQSQSGAWAHYKLYKYVQDSPDTLYVTEDSVPVSRDAFDAQLIRENDTFPKEKIIIGIKEQKQKNIESKFQVMPTITNGNVKIYGINAFSVYNSAGQRIDKKENNSGEYYINGPDGIYFLKPEEQGFPTKKIIKKK